MSIPEAMEYLNDLKLRQQELEQQNKELRAEYFSLKNEILELEGKLKKKSKLPRCDCCLKQEKTLFKAYDEYYEMDMMFCKDCLNQR